MKRKRGVIIGGCSAEILYAAIVVEAFFTSRGVEMVITEGMATIEHSRRSSHYRGDGIDLRSWTLKTMERKQAVLRDMKRKLGFKYVVILESIGKKGEHFHIQFVGEYIQFFQ